MKQEEDKGLFLSVDMQADLINSRWPDVVKAKRIDVLPQVIQDFCKEVFVLGVGYAWQMVAELSSGLAEVDRLNSDKKKAGIKRWLRLPKWISNMIK